MLKYDMENDDSQEGTVDELMAQLGMTPYNKTPRRRGVTQSKEEKSIKANNARKNKYKNDIEYYNKIRKRCNSYYRENVSGTEKEKLRIIRKHYKLQYGITKEEVYKLIVKQNWLCAICGSDNGKRALCVDHNHKTGQIREMLCTPCNAAIGNFKESYEIILNALAYLKKHNGTEQ